VRLSTSVFFLKCALNACHLRHEFPETSRSFVARPPPHAPSKEDRFGQRTLLLWHVFLLLPLSSHENCRSLRSCASSMTTFSCDCRVLPVTTVSCGVNSGFRYVWTYFSLLLLLSYRQHFYLLVCRLRVVRTCESSVHGYFFVIYLLRVRRSSVAFIVIVSGSFFKTF
jgi:hypothetical protein